MCQRLGVATLPDELADFIQAKAEGHPFFSEEIAYALRDTGLIEVAAGRCRVLAQGRLEDVNFPSTVQGVITSRLDRLDIVQNVVQP